MFLKKLKYFSKISKLSVRLTFDIQGKTSWRKWTKRVKLVSLKRQEFRRHEKTSETLHRIVQLWLVQSRALLFHVDQWATCHGPFSARVAHPRLTLVSSFSCGSLVRRWFNGAHEQPERKRPKSVSISRQEIRITRPDISHFSPFCFFARQGVRKEKCTLSLSPSHLASN